MSNYAQHQQNPFKSQRGFSLLELLVVMLIIGLLTGLGISSYVTAQKKSRDNRRKQDLSSISKALEVYYNDWGRYPGYVLVGDNAIMEACGDTAQSACVWGELWQGQANTLYMTELPMDPSDGLSYAYQNSGDGYRLFAHLENDQDPDVVRDADDQATSYAGVNCGTTENCNYVLMSSNLSAEPAIVSP